MNRDVEYSDKERKRARQILEGDARSVKNGNKNSPQVARERCSVWRDWIASGKYSTPNQIPSDHWKETVRNHVVGDCRHNAHEVGVPCTYQDGEWVRVGVTSEKYVNRQYVIVHTRECRAYPERPVALSRVEYPEVEVAVCKFCTRSERDVPEAGPVPRASSDD